MSELKNKKFLGFGDQKTPEKPAAKPPPVQSKGSFNSLKLIENKNQSVTRLPSVSSHATPAQSIHPVAPVRDFQKVSNSINRDAIPNGLFRTGASKKIYDVLYGLTRGAINPSRKVNIKKSELMKKCDIGARVTLDAGVSHLQEVGLIKLGVVGGKHVGNEFEVFLPEEAEGESLTRHSSQARHSSVSDHAHFPDTLDTLESRHARQAQVLENTSSYAPPKTLIKTKEEKDDDEPSAAASPFSEFNKLMSEASRKITGRETTQADREKWKHVAEILVAQLEIISARTAVSNAPAILAEHLHRTLNSRRAQEQQGLITPREAKIAREKQTKETPPDLHLCPDCFGTSFWNPDGKGRRPGCPHSKLEEAREEAAKNKEL